jgi:hypothetical protein
MDELMIVKTIFLGGYCPTFDTDRSRSVELSIERRTDLSLVEDATNCYRAMAV